MTDRVPRLLLLEPAMLCQRHLAMLLQQEGYDLVLTRNLGEAQGVIRQGGVDLVLASADLPRGGAMELVTWLRRDPATYGLPLILMFSSYDMADAVREAVRQDIFQSLLKPVQSKDLLTMLTGILSPLPVRGQDVVLAAGQEMLRGRIKLALRSGEAPQYLVAVSDPTAFSRLATHPTVELSFQGPGEARITWQASITADQLMVGDDGLTEGVLEVRMLHLLGREDRRRYLRKRLSVPVRYRLPGDFYRLGTSVDLSVGGMLLGGVVRKEVELGIRIEISLFVNGTRGTIHLTGEIRRQLHTDEGLQWGLSFPDITEEQQDALLQVVFGEVGEGLPVAAIA